jgi:hypothetical protein
MKSFEEGEAGLGYHGFFFFREWDAHGG